MSTLAYDPEASPRDLRLDLLRGLCLVKMIFSHLWVTPPLVVTRGLGFITGAEGFFLISGVVLGLVYHRRVAVQGLKASSQTLWQRSLNLYLANLALVFLFLTLELTDRVHERHFRLHWPGGLDWPQVFILDQPYYLHVLPRYVVFVALAPLALWCMQRGWTRWLLLVSVGLHGWRWFGGEAVHLPFLERPEAFFPLASWQMLFLVGMVLGYHRPQLVVWSRKWLAPSGSGLLWGILLGVGFTAFAMLRIVLFGDGQPLSPEFLALIDRQSLGYLRLVNLTVAFGFLFWLTDRFWVPIRRWTGGLLLPVGQNALYVFLLHIPFVWAAKMGLGPRLHGLLPEMAMGWLYFGVECAVVSLLWWMVRRRFLFQLIPR